MLKNKSTKIMSQTRIFQILWQHRISLKSVWYAKAIT